MCYNYFRKMVKALDNVVIGPLTILYKDKWENYKMKRPALYDELEFANVKEIDEKRVLIDESRLKEILKIYKLSDF